MNKAITFLKIVLIKGKILKYVSLNTVSGCQITECEGFKNCLEERINISLKTNRMK